MSLQEQVRETKASLLPQYFYKKKEPSTWKEKFVKGLADILSVEMDLQKTSTVVPSFTWTEGPQKRKPQTDYYNLVLKTLFNWPIRVVVNAIVRECTRNWGHIEPRFTLKCHKCGEEYYEEIDECLSTREDSQGKEIKCDGNLRPPDYKQKIRFRKLTKKTSRNRKFYEFVRASIWYELATDSIFWSLVYDKVGGQYGHSQRFRGKEVFLEHPGFIFPVADEFGLLGDSNYFCPDCYNQPEYKGNDLHWDMRDDITGDPEKDRFKCPICGRLMVRTSYIQEIGGKITARFGANEIVHASRNRLPPSLFGNPDTIAALEILEFMDAVDKKKKESIKESRTAGLLAFPGLSQDSVTAMLNSIKQERAKLTTRDLRTGEPETAKRSSLIFIGLDEVTEKPIRVPFEDPEEMSQNIEFYKMYLRAVGDIFGVSTVIFQAASEKRGGGSEIRLQIEVANRTAEEHQRVFMEAFNEDLLPLFEITDWIWVFDKIEPKDKLRDAQILVQKSAAALNFLKAGFNVKMDDKGELIVTGEGKLVVDDSRMGLPNEQEGVTPGGVGAERAPETENPSED